MRTFNEQFRQPRGCQVALAGFFFFANADPPHAEKAETSQLNKKKASFLHFFAVCRYVYWKEIWLD